MHLALLPLLAIVASPPQAPEAPTLAIRSIAPRTEQTAGCSVTLVNTYHRSAVAWVIETLPYHDTGSTSDHALAPGARLGPKREVTVFFPCQPGELPALEVVAAVYDDNAIAGDRNTLFQHILRARLSRATGIDELAQLLRYARPAASSANDPARKQIADLIRLSSGASIDKRVQDEALTALSRSSGKTKQTEETFAGLITSLRAELAQAAGALRAVNTQEFK